MKEGVNYKSKRAITIAAILIALFAVAAIGTVAFIKGNQDASATAENNTGNQSIEAENGVTNDTNTDNEAKTNEASTDNSTYENNITNPATGDANTNSQLTNGNNTNNGNNSNNNSTETSTDTNSTTESTNNGTTTTANSADVPTTEYTQTGETIERKISDSFYVSWQPIGVKAITEQINRPELEIHKMSYINNETENDQEIHSAVVPNDFITYKISIKNKGNVDANNIHIYDSVPEGTKFISVYDEGTEKNDKLTWVKNIKAGEEVIVSFRVKVIFAEDSKGKEITQIDNTAIVDGNETETTHNPIITAQKEVKPIAENTNGELKELDNQAVIPGSRLRYYVSLTNTSEYDGTTKVTDKIPEGTSLINGTISQDGEVDKNNVITWRNVEVKAGETVKVYFDVTVNRGTRNTVTNRAEIGPERPEEPNNPENPDNPEDPTPEKPTPEDPRYTNEVKTPVLLALKVSEQDGKTLHETNTINYKIEITNTANPDDEQEAKLAGIAKLVDKFWNGEAENDAEAGAIGDNDKVEFVPGSIKINGELTRNGEEYLEDLEVEVEPGDTVTIEYQYNINQIAKDIPDEGTVTEIIRNNLYWKNPGEDDPSRPSNPNDTTNYENPPRDDDPTPAEKDPNDNDNTNKDPDHPIDTVKVNVKEEYIKKTAIKTWDDYSNMFEIRPAEVTFTIYRNNEPLKNEDGRNITKTLTINDKLSANDINNWKTEFTKLKKYNANNEEYTYTIQEANVNSETNENYKIVANNVEDDALRITNQYINTEVTAEKHVKVISNSGSELENQPVVPGTRLRYKITLTNTTKVDAFRTIEDIVPEGTTLYQENGNDVVSSEFFAGKTLADGKTTLKWEKVKVPAAQATGASSTTVSFDVIVNNSTRETVKNTATTYKPEDPENSKEETKKVQTPVLIARKTSKKYDGNSYTEKEKIKYLVEIVATDVNGENSEPVTATIAKLVDKYWNGDESKVKYISGNIKVNGTVKNANIAESEVKNISVSLKAGDKASVEYIYEANNLPANVETQIIKNNLYWAKPGENDPARPGDSTEYSNPNPDRDNEFKNNELKDYIDPTSPEVDPRDNDTTNKDPQKPIDTVVVEIFAIKAKKKVNAVSTSGSLLDNQPVVPGSRLRYTIELTNKSKNEGTINVSDVIPTGTTLIPGTITDGGTNSNGIIKWTNLKVTAKTTKPISFDVTVNNNTRTTVKNSAKTGTDPDPSDQTPTNEVQTPVIIARKKSKVSDGTTLNGNNINEVTYLVEIVATDVDSKNTVAVREATVKLIDKFWTGDDTKVEYKSGSLKTTGFVNGKSSDEETIKNIEAKLAAGGKVTLQYTYKLKQIGSSLNKDTIENNLYWAKPGDNDPERPENGDNTKYSNPNPDSNNQFKNEELKDYKDPTNPEKDPSDNDNSNKDSSSPIDTVKVTLIKYGDIEVEKKWIDNGHTDQRPNNGITVNLFGRDKKKAVQTKTGIKGTGDNWKIKFENLPLADEQGTIPYSVTENAINNYATEIKGLTIENTFRQDVEGLITIKNTKTATVPVDVVFVLDISGSMLSSTKASDLEAWEKNGITPPNSYSSNNRAIDMVASVNSAIKNIMEGNPNNRVGIALFNRQGYEMLQLGRYTAKSGSQYIKFANNSNGTVDKNTNNDKKAAYIVANVNQSTTKQYVQFRDNNDWAINKNLGTNTQAGIISGYNIFKNVSSTVTNNNGAGKGVKHKPVMILLTDGDPTHIYTTSKTDPRNVTDYSKVSFVANNKINPSANPKFPVWNNTVTDEDDECYGLVDKTESIYYAKTMDTINYAKTQVTSRYSKSNDGEAKTCKLYTIGMYMKGAMAEVLLNPTTANIKNLNTGLNDISTEITNKAGNTQLTKYKNGNTVLTEKAYYNKQQKDLYKQLGTNFENYADKSYNGKMTQAQMNAAFTEIVNENAQEDIQITIDNSKNRTKIELKDIDKTKEFSLKVKIPKDSGTTTTYNTLAKAQNSGYVIYDNDKKKYYLDLSKIPAGTTSRIDVVYYSV